MQQAKVEISDALPLAAPSRQPFSALITKPASRTNNAPNYQISAKLGNPQPSYSDITIFNLGTVHHPGFDQMWISTIPQPPWIHSAPAHQISAQLGNAQLSYNDSSIWRR